MVVFVNLLKNDSAHLRTIWGDHDFQVRRNNFPKIGKQITVKFHFSPKLSFHCENELLVYS